MTVLRFLRLGLLAALASAAASAQTAPRATAVHAAPDANAAVLRLIKTGEPLPASASATTAPAGWTAVTLPGPHDVFVENRFIGKDLDIKPGSPLHTAPKSDAPVLTTSTAEDEMEITGLRGRWTQLRINKSVIGYLQGATSATTAAPRPSSAPVATSTPVRDSAPVSSNAVSASPAPRPVAGQAIERTDAERSSLAALPRLFEGKLATTRSPLRPRRPYDWALEADDGTRFAYLDFTKLLLTEQIESYQDRVIVVYGVARTVPDTKDIVIAVESLQLR